MKTPDTHPKGIFAPFKNPDGSFKKWVYILFVIAAVVVIRDVLSVSGLYPSNQTYEKEIRLVMNELKGMGGDFLATGEVGGVTLNNDYVFEYEGPRILHDYLVNNHASGVQMDLEFESIEERTFDDIKIYELNDPKVIEEVKVAYKKQKEILISTFERDRAYTEKMIKGIEILHKNSPDDIFVSGIYSAFVETQPASFAIADEVLASSNEFAVNIDQFLNFLLANNGKYEFDKKGTFIASPDLLMSYNQQVEKLEVATAQLNKIQAKYMESLASVMSKLDDSGY